MSAPITPDYVYLDYNAGAPVRPEAAEAAAKIIAAPGNASSVHGGGRRARRLIEAARDEVAALIAVGPAAIIFTSGGTEANALALAGARAEGRALYIGATEHASIRQAAPEATLLPVDGAGVIRLDAMARALEADPRPKFVALMLANNETGAIQPVGEAVRLAHAHGARLHCDAIQAAGKIAIDGTTLGADSLSLSAHKLGGLAGVGALVLAPEAQISPLWRGGGQERGRRAGTENAPGIASFGAAARVARAEMAAEAQRLAGLRDGLERRISQISPSTRFHGQGAPRLANTSAFDRPGHRAETTVIALDLARIAVSAGAACSSGKVETSSVLAAMGIDAARAAATIRVSLGWASQPADIDRLVEAWAALERQAHAAGASAA